MINEEIENNDPDIGEQEELFEHHRIIVDKGQSPQRIDKYLFMRLQNISRNRIQNAAEVEAILVNEKAVKSSYKVKPLDTISIVLSYPPREIELYPDDIALNIVYEDEYLLVIDKQAGLVKTRAQRRCVDGVFHRAVTPSGYHGISLVFDISCYILYS